MYLSVDVCCRDTRCAKRFRDVLAVRPVDAVTDGSFPRGEILVILYDVADHVGIVHLTDEVALDVLSKTHMRCSRVKLRWRRIVVIWCQIAGRNKFGSRRPEDKRLEYLTEPLPANPLRCRRHAENIGGRKLIDNLAVGIGNDMMTLITDKKIGRLHLRQTMNERLHRGNLHRQIVFLRRARCNQSVTDAHRRECRRRLLDQFLPMHHENSAPPRKCRAARHPCRHNRLARAAGGNGAHAPPPL